MPDKLEERLVRVESSDCGQGGFTTNWYRNPDGPEALAEITRLKGEVEELRDDKASLLAVVDHRARRVSDLEALIDELVEGLEVALPRLAHKHACWSCRPSVEWAEHGSASYENCDCEIKTVRSLISKARSSGKAGSDA